MAPYVPSQGGWTTIKVLTVLLGLSFIALVLRFIARYKIRTHFGADDAWAILAFIFFCANVSMDFWSIYKGGVGYPLASFTPDQIVVSLQADWISTWLNLLNVLCVKLCVLCLYRRIFIQKTFQRVSMALGIIMTCHLFAIMLALAFRCLPVESIWTPTMKPTVCINYIATFLAGATINSVLDAVLLCLPLFMIKRLHMPLQKKLELGGIFLLGAGSVIASVLRIVMSYSPDPPQDNRVKLIIWSNVEPAVALICACLFVMRPIIPVLSMSKVKSYLSWKHRVHSPGGSTMGASNSSLEDKPKVLHDSRGLVFDGSQLTTDSGDRTLVSNCRVSTHVTSQGRNDHSETENHEPGIEVKKAISVV